jgi:hypothetical protein
MFRCCGETHRILRRSPIFRGTHRKVKATGCNNLVGNNSLGMPNRRATQRRTINDLQLMTAALVLQRHHRLIAAAESCHPQQAASPLRHGHHWPIAVDRMASSCKIPLSTLVFCRLLARRGSELGRLRQLRDGKGHH